MINHILVRLLFLGAVFTSSIASAQSEKVGQTDDLKDKNINREGYDTESTVLSSKISVDNLQGLWQAFKGVYRFGEHVNGMTLEKPFIIEVEGNKYRRNLDSKLKTFTLKDNIITMVDGKEKSTGITNKITATELVISWKYGSNYTRYYYTK